MVKTGIAFSDYVSNEKIRRRKSNGRRGGEDLVRFFPVFVLLVIIAVLILRLIYLQIIQGYYYKVLAEDNRTKTKIIPAQRGVITDRNGKSLVRNYPSFKVIKDGKATIISKNEALSRMAKNEEVLTDTQREYIYKDLFAHVLGYTGQISSDEVNQREYSSYHISDFVGKMGLEKEYEEVLHGKNGRELYEVDASGVEKRFLGKEEPVSGETLKTTLDVSLQEAAADALAGASKAAVIVTDPNDGGILALYSKPTFDSNLFTHGKEYEGKGKYPKLSVLLSDLSNQPFLNRVISGLYPPGSTFKLVTAVAALEAHAINKDTKFVDNGILKVGAFSFGNWYFLQYGRTDGVIDVVGAIKRSNDIFFYKAAEAAGISNIFKMSKAFGIGDLYGIDIPGEVTGSIPNPSWKEKNIGEQWYLGDTYNLGIGQGYLLTTPLEVNMWTSVFASGGTLFEPHLIFGKGKILKQDFIKREYVELVREGMKQSCENGGVAWPFFNFKISKSKFSKKFKIDNHDFTEEVATGGAKFVRIKLGCKTGTAEVGGKETKSHAWITLFAPFYKPKIVVTVLVENSGEGSSVAGPIAKQIVSRYFESNK